MNNYLFCVIILRVTSILYPGLCSSYDVSSFVRKKMSFFRHSSGLTIALNYSSYTYRYVTPPNRYIQRYAIGVRFIWLQITMSKNIDTCQFGLRWVNLAFL